MKTLKNIVADLTFNKEAGCVMLKERGTNEFIDCEILNRMTMTPADVKKAIDTVWKRNDDIKHIVIHDNISFK